MGVKQTAQCGSSGLVRRPSLPISLMQVKSADRLVMAAGSRLGSFMGLGDSRLSAVGRGPAPLTSQLASQGVIPSGSHRVPSVSTFPVLAGPMLVIVPLANASPMHKL